MTTTSIHSMLCPSNPLAIPLLQRKSFFLVALIALLSLHCGSGDSNNRVVPGDVQAVSVDAAYRDYIAAFTAGQIPRRNPVTIRFARDMVAQQSVGNAISEASALVFDPALEGTLVWTDRRTLEFRPDEALEGGTTYQGTLALQQFFQDLPEETEAFNFQFWTAERTLDIRLVPLEASSNDNLELQVLEGVVRSSDYEEGADIQSVVSARYMNQNRSIRWEHSEDGMRHVFYVDDLQRQEEAENLSVRWDASALDIDFRGEETVAVPARSSFTFIRAQATYTPERYIQVYFSDPIQPDQDLNGLLRVSGYLVRTRVEGNRVEIHPSRAENSFSGEVTVSVEAGIRNVADSRLEERTEVTLTFEEMVPAVQFANKSGSIMPTTENAPFTFQAVNLSKADVRIVKVYEKNIHQFFQVNSYGGKREMQRVGKLLMETTVDLRATRQDLKQWSTYAVDLSDLIAEDPGAIYEVSVGFRPSYSLYPCESPEWDGDTLPELEEEKTQWSYSSDYYEYSWEDRNNNPCSKGYYNYERVISGNVLSSDLGLIAKRGASGSIFAYVTDLRTTAPLGNVELEVYDLTRDLIGRATSNSFGMAEVVVDGDPFLLVASRGAQRGYLKVQEGQSLSISRFDVGGMTVQEGIGGYIYGERGVWRPGDDIHLTFILDDVNNTLPDNHPVVFELSDPRGQVVDRFPQNESVNNFYAFRTHTVEDAITGTYTASVHVGGVTFTKPIKVETIMPNRMKIEFDVEEPYLAQGSAANEMQMNVTWLHGAVARNLKADVQATLEHTATKFDGYEAYYFDDDSREYFSHSNTIFDQSVDDNGQATFTMDLTANDQAPGMLRANLTTKVFEPGGAFSIDQFSVPYHPYETYVGMQLPELNRWGAIRVDGDLEVGIALVDRDGNPVASDDLIVNLYRVDWRWWWDWSDDRTTNYNVRDQSQLVGADTLSIDATGRGTATVRFDVDYGRYLVRACDTGGHCTGQVVRMWRAWGRPTSNQPGGETMLVFSADKEQYNVGETVTLSIPSPEEGRALITLETGTEVLSSTWVNAEKGTTTYEFETRPEMAPTLYASVSLVQPHAQTANDLPIRMYGVIPIEVYNPETRIQPVLTMDDELRPEEPATIRVSEQNGKPMTYTVAVVDEGLLDLTRFKTPNPWDHFYARRALATKTWDLYDDVLGASSMEYQALLSIGGGDEGLEEGASKVNRFTPVVHYLGPFELDANKTATHDIEMPLYVGSVRTMVIAGNDGAFGMAEKATPVRKPLMLLGTLPRVLGTDEEVDFYLSVFAMNDDVRNVDIELSTSDLLEPLGDTRQRVTFSRAGESVVAFPLKVAQATGTATVRAVATSGGERTEYTFDIDVRHPNPPVVEVSDHVLEAGESWRYVVEPFGIMGTNSGVIEVSSLPPLNLGTRLNYLIRYPHGCVEQTTSAVFPQLSLPDLIELSDGRKERIEQNVRRGIERLRRFQRPDGGLGYWRALDDYNEWGTNYAGHFMLEARRKGYTVPADFMDDWMAFQRRQAVDWTHRSDAAWNARIQAYRLYLLALAGEPELGSMNRFREGRYGDNTTKWLLAAAYHLAGRPEAARDISASLTWDLPSYRELSYTYGTHTRDKAIILQTLIDMDRMSEAFPIVQELSEILNRPNYYMNTQETAFSLLATLNYGAKQDIGLDVSYQFEREGQQRARYDDPYYEIDMGITNLNPRPISFTNNMDAPVFVKAILRGAPPVGEETDAESSITIDVVYKNMEGTIISPDRLEQGTDFMAEVTVARKSGDLELRELALSQIFPAGWEIHRKREAETESEETQYARPTFQDIRDDRIYTYFDLRRREQSKTFHVLLNASYRGRFYLPAVSVEAMYDADIHARKKGQWVEIVDP